MKLRTLLNRSYFISPFRCFSVAKEIKIPIMGATPLNKKITPVSKKLTPKVIIKETPI